MVTEQSKIQKDLGQVSLDVRLTKSRLDELEQRMTNLEDKMETKFNQVDRKFAHMDAKLDQILDMMASRGQPTYTADTAVAPGRASMSVPDLSTTAHVREHSSRNPLVKRILGATRGFIGQITNHAADFNRQLEHLEQRGIPEEDEGQRQHQSNAGSSRSGTSRSGQRSGQQAPPPWLNQQIMPDRR
ncbi:hypothetical protein PYCCODRAFT_1104621 [Trametes coccinea BRFM310]|uniref:Uncharacterized protein n=1 Tax=Trametes coccinea (strain BRFM310) TaxID=1353009 RepID=A0A1Y2IAR9_TRAC3|nr:hypothetical protein PYCCODRAFT_1104621 [Trametes coccinea BRFM310]